MECVRTQMAELCATTEHTNAPNGIDFVVHMSIVTSRELLNFLFFFVCGIHSEYWDSDASKVELSSAS